MLRALGASTRYLLRDSLVQSIVLLAVSAGLGIGIGLALGAAVSSTSMPFALEATPIAVATALLLVLGLIGAALAVVRITLVDPLAALGGNRMTEALSLSDVTLAHGDGEDTMLALDHVSFEAAAGELVAVVGPSGSGKSSLLALAGALTQPSSGSVRLGEVDLAAASRRELTRIRRERIGFVFQTGNLIPALSSIDQLRPPLTFGRFDDSQDPRRLLAVVGMEHGVAAVMVTHDHEVLHHCDRVLEMVDGRLRVPLPVPQTS